ncbi:MAG: GNAT family N-acetyltransferase [Thermoplasmata archaeon]
MPTPSFVSPAAAPEDWRRLQGEFHRFLASFHPTWGSAQAKSLFQQTERGWLYSLVWRPTAGDALGLAFAQDTPSGSRIHGVWVEPADSRSLARFLHDFEREMGRPVVVITDVLPGMELADQVSFFEERGYWHRAKVLMRREMRRGVLSPPGSSEIRPLLRSDIPELVTLYSRAYHERPGEFWVWTAPDPVADAELTWRSLLDPSGEWVPNHRAEASFVWVANKKVVGAVAVEDRPSGVPYISDLIVDPEHHRHGIGRRLMERTLLELSQGPSEVVELAAIQYGAPYRLYEKIGFREVAPPDGRYDGHWVLGPDPTRGLRGGFSGPRATKD